MLKIGSILVVCIMLAGCAGMSAAMEYSGISPVHFQDSVRGYTWRIFDKPNEGRLMITPTIGEAFSEGALSGLTIGAADTDIPKSRYQEAAAEWLASTGRSCKILDGYKLIKPQWEFKYRCADRPMISH